VRRFIRGSNFLYLKVASFFSFLSLPEIDTQGGYPRFIPGDNMEDVLKRKKSNFQNLLLILEKYSKDNHQIILTTPMIS
jgi:hypothetical protein